MPLPADKSNKVRVYLALCGKLLPFVPLKWKPVAGAALNLALVLLAAITVPEMVNTGGGTPPAPAPGYYASAITVDMEDLDLRVENGVAQVLRTVAPLQGDVAPQAPLMTWENTNVRSGTLMRWCLAELAGDRDAADTLRETLNELSGKFPRNIRWQEACPGDYSAGLSAEIDCGIGDQAVACAVYLGATRGRVSVNGKFAREGRISRSGKRVAWAHEVQHLLMNLGHNNCGVVIDPASGRAVPSVMAAIILPDGPTCTEPGAMGLTPDDWPLAVQYYNLQPAATPTATATATRTADPTATATSTPEPTPTRAPTPTARTQRVVLQEWVPNGTCTNPIDGWCRREVTLSQAPSGAYYVIKVRLPDGSERLVGDFQWVEP